MLEGKEQEIRLVLKTVFSRFGAEKLHFMVFSERCQIGVVRGSDFEKCRPESISHFLVFVEGEVREMLIYTHIVASDVKMCRLLNKFTLITLYTPPPQIGRFSIYICLQYYLYISIFDISFFLPNNLDISFFIDISFS